MVLYRTLGFGFGLELDSAGSKWHQDEKNDRREASERWAMFDRQKKFQCQDRFGHQGQLVDQVHSTGNELELQLGLRLRLKRAEYDWFSKFPKIVH
jgi:hypothetical protein